MEKQTPEQIEENIEKLVGELYSNFYRLNEAGLFQKEYDLMGALLRMLQEDRVLLRSKVEDM